MTSDLELDLVGVALYMSGYTVDPESALPSALSFQLLGLERVGIHLASFRRQISMNCLMSETSRGIVGESVRKRVVGGIVDGAAVVVCL